jgi:RNA polymerase sigma factor (sigma-70 family)
MITIDMSEIYRLHYKRLVYQVNMMIKDMQMAEDVVQETFIKAMKNMGTIQSTDKIAAWLSIIAKRTAIDMIRCERSKKGILMEQDELAKLWVDYKLDVEKEVEFAIFLEDVQEGILELGTIYQDVMVLKVKDGLKVHEIASRLNLKLSTVKTRINRARKQLINQFEDKVIA